MPEQPDNIIDLMPYLEGQKFGWTVDMTDAVLKHGDARPLKVEEFLKP